MDLDRLANLVEIFGITSLVGGLAFAMIQVVDFRRQRKEIAAIEMMKSWQTAEFASALRTVAQLPDHMAPEAMRKDGEDLENLAFIVGVYFESVGVMVYREIVPLDVIDDLMGGASRVVWRKLDRWVEDWRSNYNPRAYEWFEWLVERLDESSPLDREYIAPLRFPVEKRQG